MRILTLAALVAAVASPSVAQSLLPGETLSTIEVRPISAPNPVLGADDRQHLAYELLVVNPSRFFVTLDRIEATDSAGAVLGTLEGDALAAVSILWSGEKATLPPGGSVAVLLDVTFPADATLPDRVMSRVSATRQSAGPDGKPAPWPANAPFPASFVFTGAETPVGAPAVVVAPPLRGDGWAAINGCCDTITSHRGALIPVDGRLRVPERFAIDWVKLDENGRIFTGDGSRLEDFAYFGAEILSATDGTVVNTYDEADEQVPNQPATGITPENIGGNMVVVDIGGGAFAFYAHLQRGSQKVKLGDKVTTGQVLGLLGNTGNSTAPHLHFHVMDSPSPLDANGLPYVFTRFTSRGFLTSDDALERGVAAEIDPRLAGTHENQLPLDNEVVGFD